LIGCGVIYQISKHAPGGRDVIAYNNMMSGSLEEFPQPIINPDKSWAVAIGGDLRKIDVIREFWQIVIEIIDSNPPALWMNFTSVVFADTKLAACIIAILRRAEEQNVHVYIVGSDAVQEMLHLCKMPPLKYFTGVNKAA